MFSPPNIGGETITDRVLNLLVETAHEVCARWGVTIVAADGTMDHLHILISYPPSVELSKLISAVKTITSKRVRAQCWPEVTKALWGEHFWSPSYCVVSTGGAPLAIVKRYVLEQREPKRAGPKTM